MGFTINQLFVCYSAVGGPYLKGSIILCCQDEACLYRESYRMRGRTKATLGVAWKHILGIVRDMSRLRSPVSVVLPHIGEELAVSVERWRGGRRR